MSNWLLKCEKDRLDKVYNIVTDVIKIKLHNSQNAIRFPLNQNQIF